MEFQIPKIVHEELDEQRGVFEIEPLDRGFGYTFGNSLRRVLLSSLEGAAVTSVKIEGISHEFTTLQGVREDVTDIILNLKSGSPAEQVVRDATDLTASVTPWLQADHDGLTGKVLKWPTREEIDTPVQESLIVELYSK